MNNRYLSLLEWFLVIFVTFNYIYLYQKRLRGNPMLTSFPLSLSLSYACYDALKQGFASKVFGEIFLIGKLF